MARWRLTANHYLNTIDTFEWEYKQVDRRTGREVRKRMPVPRFLDIKDPGDWTIKPDGLSIAQGGQFDEAEGWIVVCHEGKGQPGDIEFLGDPTPEMIPMDEEAKAISESFADKWRYKPDSAEISHSQSMIDRYEVEIAELKDKTSVPTQVTVPGLEKLVEQMAAVIANQTALTESVLKPRKLV